MAHEKPCAAITNRPLSSSLTPVNPDSEDQDVEKTSPQSPSPEAASQEAQNRDPFLVDFESLEDPINPYNWSSQRKWLLLANLCGLGLSTNMSILLCSPATGQIISELRPTDVHTSVYSTLIVSIWNLGAIIGALIIGPLSEVYGRLPVYHTCNAIGLALLVGQTQSRSISQLLALRLLNGLFVATTSLNPSIVGDVWPVEQRGRAQSIVSLFLTVGPVAGPIVGGWVAHARGWRWTFWTAFFLNAFSSATMLLQFRETYVVAILRSKARRVRRQTGDRRFRSRYCDEDGALTRSLPAKLSSALVRPIRCFAVPIFAVLVLPGCLTAGYSYVLATSLPLVFQDDYGFNEGQSGLTFLGVAIGMALGAIFCSGWLDRYTAYMKRRSGDGEIKPEWRLPPILVGYALVAAGLFWYGWTAERRDPAVVPIVGTGLVGFAAYIIQLPVKTYLADVFGIYRASAFGALTMFTNALSALLPLAGPPLYGRYGLGWGNSVLAFIALAFLPLTLLVLTFGEGIRKRSDAEKRLGGRTTSRPA